MFTLREEKKYVRIILGVTLTLFFLACIFTIFKYGLKFENDTHTLLGNLNNPDNDDVKFIRSAWILAETGNYVYHNPPNPTVFMMPGLPYTLAFFTKIFGKLGGITAYRVFQSLVQTGSLLMVFFIGRKIFNSKVGVLAVVINALCITEVWVSNLILTETMFKFLVLVLLYFTLYAIERNELKFYMLGGVAWGLATLFRPTIATFPIIILIAWIERKYSFIDMLKNTVIVSIIFCIILSPWWIRNYRTFDKFIPLTLATGNPMLQGTYINYDQSTMKTDGLDYSQFKYPAGTEMENNKVEMEILKYRLKNLVPKQPLQFLYWYTIGKTIKQINAPFYWRSIHGISRYAELTLYYSILIIGTLGIINYFRNKRRNKLGTVIFSTIIYFIVAYLPFYAFSRYFYPAVPLLIIFASSYILGLFGRNGVLSN